MPNYLTLITDRKTLVLNPYTLIVWIDETGHEEFADLKFPVFGLGGSAVLATDYEAALAAPWRAMKNEVFEGETASLHAAELRSPHEVQLNRLSRFFNEQQFARLAAVTRRDATKPPSVTTMQLMATLIRDWINELIGDVFKQAAHVALIFEESDRLARQVLANFSHWKVRAKAKETPIELLRAAKTVVEPGLEVADFIMHTAGAQANRDTWPPLRRDYHAIFLPSGLDQRWIKFRQITEVKLN